MRMKTGAPRLRPSAASRLSSVGEVGRAGQRHAERSLRQAAGALGLDLQVVPVEQDVAASTAGDQQRTAARPSQNLNRSARIVLRRLVCCGTSPLTGRARSSCWRACRRAPTRSTTSRARCRSGPSAACRSSTLATSRILGPGTMTRWNSAISSPGRGRNGSGLGRKKAGQAPSGSSRARLAARPGDVHHIAPVAHGHRRDLPASARSSRSPPSASARRDRPRGWHGAPCSRPSCGTGRRAPGSCRWPPRNASRAIA